MGKLKKLLKKQGFTLVELIIVIAIIAVLAVAAFMMLTKWLANSRDSRRIADSTTVRTALEIYSTTNATYPMPDNYLAIMVSGAVIGYQGYLGPEVIKNIDELVKAPIDPNGGYITYYVDRDRNNYEIMTFLEKETTFFNEVSAVDLSVYKNMKPKTDGDKLGIILQEETQIPIHLLKTGNLELLGNTVYEVYMDDNNILIGDGDVLKSLKGIGSLAYGLAGYWSFDDANYSVIGDNSGKAKVLTYSGTITPSSMVGQVGNAVALNGSGFYYNEDLGFVGSGTIGSTHTISAWIKPPVIPECGDSNICREWILLLGEHTKGSHHWLIGGRDGPTQFGLWSSTQANPDFIIGEWNFITITASVTGDLKAYLNGQEINTGIDSPINEKLLDLGSGYLKLGGGIDELRVYNRALTNMEIKALYEATK